MDQLKNKKLSDQKEDLIAQIKAAGLQPPESMTLMVTDGCNLFCRHCWHNCRTREKAAPVATPKILKLINAFARLGGRCITLTGGEVLSHPNWYTLLSYCTEHRRLDSVCLQTNATLITREHIRALQSLRLDKLTVQVSLDGAHARTHNFVRGPGSYTRAMAGLQLLVQAGLGAVTQVAFTEMAHNLDELPELLEKIDKMGLAGLVSGTLVKGGRAMAAAQIDLPTPAQYWELVDFYHSDAIFKALYDQKGNIAAIEWYQNRLEYSDGCCSCLKSLFVDAGGRMYPCTMLLLDRYAVDKVYSRPLHRTIAAALSKWREIPEYSRGRRHLIPSCARCSYKHHCGGGCVGRAATANEGQLMMPEDRCALRKAVYSWTKLPSVASFCRRS